MARARLLVLSLPHVRRIDAAAEWLSQRPMDEVLVVDHGAGQARRLIDRAVRQTSASFGWTPRSWRSLALALARFILQFKLSQRRVDITNQPLRIAEVADLALFDASLREKRLPL